MQDIAHFLFNLRTTKTHSNDNPDACPCRIIYGDSPTRNYSRELDSLRRERDSIKRILSQANLEELSNELEKLNTSITEIERELAGN